MVIVHVAESLERVGCLKEVSAIAIQYASLMAEFHFAFEYLRFRVVAPLVVIQFIGVQQVNAVTLLTSVLMLFRGAHSL